MRRLWRGRLGLVLRVAGILPAIRGQDALDTQGRDALATSYGHTTNRRLVRGLCLLLAIVALSPIASGTFLSAVVPALSPFVAMTALLATRTWHALAWLGLLVGAAALLRRRIFCRWVCPAGLCLDGASWLGRRLGHRTSRFPSLGAWIVGLTLGGALLGYPFLLWLDPLARFAGLSAVGDRGAGMGLGLSVGGFTALLLLDLLWPHIWCTRLCPLGTSQDLLHSLAGAFRRVASSTLEYLFGPRLSSGRVPPTNSFVGAASSQDHGQTSLSVPPPVCTAPVRASRDPGMVTADRRHVLLAVGAGAAWAAGVGPRRQRKSRPLRPPGAADESDFQGLCTRCGNCVQACPSGIIAPDLGPNGWAGLLTPVLHFQKDYCREDCVECTEVCPSGALARVPLERKARVRLGLPRVDMNVCLLGEDRECSACRNRCPYDAVRYVWSEADYTLTPQIEREKCTGCGACEAACPTTPRKAIIVFPA